MLRVVCVICFCSHDLQQNVEDKEIQKGAVEASYNKLREELAAIEKEKKEKEKLLNEKTM